MLMVGFCPPAAVHAPTTQRLLCLIAGSVWAIASTCAVCLGVPAKRRSACSFTLVRLYSAALASLCLPPCTGIRRVAAAFVRRAKRVDAVVERQPLWVAGVYEAKGEAPAALGSAARCAAGAALCRTTRQTPGPLASPAQQQCQEDCLAPATCCCRTTCTCSGLAATAWPKRTPPPQCCSAICSKASWRAGACAHRRLRRPPRGRRTRSRTRAPSQSRSPTRPASPRTSQASVRRAPAHRRSGCARGAVRRRACAAMPGKGVRHGTPDARSSVLSAGYTRAVTHALCLAGHSSLGGRAQVVGGVEVLTVTQGAATPKAVLLLFHGCSHSATDWWHASKNCPSCLGAPARGPLTQREGWGAALRGLLDTESCAVACVGRAWLIAACKPSARCPLRGAAQPALQAAAGCNSTPHRGPVPQAAAAPRISGLSPGQRLARRTACAWHAPRTATLAPRRGRARRRAALPRARAAHSSGAPRRYSDKVSAENHPKRRGARGP